MASALSGDTQALERFRREATSVARLKHPSIALVYEFGEHEGQPFFAFEWIDGENLRALLDREGRLGIPRTLRIFDRVAAALAYAHERGVIHRDVKPANLVIDPSATHTPAATAMAPTTVARTAERIQATATIAAAPTAALDADAAWLHDGYNSARNRYTGKLTPSQVNAPRWQTELEGELGETRALVMARGLLIATYENSRVVALKADTGAVIWSKQLTETIGAWPTLCYQWDNAALMVPMEDGQLAGLNLQDGAELWRMDAEALKGDVRRGMTLGDDGLVYAITGAAHVIAFDDREGKLVWSLKLEGEELTAQPALTNAGIYVISRNNAVIAVDRVKHKVVWRAEIPAPRAAAGCKRRRQRHRRGSGRPTGASAFVFVGQVALGNNRQRGRSRHCPRLGAGDRNLLRRQPLFMATQHRQGAVAGQYAGWHCVAAADRRGAGVRYEARGRIARV